MKKPIAWTVSALVVALATACGSSQQEAPPPATAPAPAADHYSGHWRGVANISSDIAEAPPTMDIEVTITSGGGTCGSFEYGAIACSGMWVCTSSYDGPVMVIEEQVRYGQERCGDSARVELRTTADPNVLEYHYTSPHIQATATLERFNH